MSPARPFVLTVAEPRMSTTADTDGLFELESLETSGLAAFRDARSSDVVEAARIEFLGQKQGKLRTAQERLKSLDPSARKAYGQRFNALKLALEAAWAGAKARLDRPAASGRGCAHSASRW